MVALSFVWSLLNASGLLLGSFWPLLGLSGAPLGLLLALFRFFTASLSAPWDILGLIWALGLILGFLLASFGLSWASLERFLDSGLLLGLSWHYLGS